MSKWLVYDCFTHVIHPYTQNIIRYHPPTIVNNHYIYYLPIISHPKICRIYYHLLGKPSSSELLPCFSGEDIGNMMEYGYPNRSLARSFLTTGQKKNGHTFLSCLSLDSWISPNHWIEKNRNLRRKRFFFRSQPPFQDLRRVRRVNGWHLLRRSRPRDGADFWGFPQGFPWGISNGDFHRNFIGQTC